MSDIFSEISMEEYMARRKEYREKMKDFNITKKYFRSIYAYIFCDICNEILDVPVDKERIRNELQTGLFTYKHTHTNPKYDPDDPEDLSNQIHSCLVYIDANYDVRGVRSFFGTEIAAAELEKGAQIPIVVKEIPPMSVHLGMLSPEEYKILQTCDGNNTLESVAEIAGIDMEKMQKMMGRLREKGLINIIRR